MESVQQFAAVIAVLGGLLAALVWLHRRGYATSRAPFASGGLLNRFKGSATGRSLEVVERLPLTATHALHLVRVDDRTVVIATSAAGCQVIDAANWDSPRGRSLGGK